MFVYLYMYVHLCCTLCIHICTYVDFRFLKFLKLRFLSFRNPDSPWTDGESPKTLLPSTGGHFPLNHHGKKHKEFPGVLKTYRGNLGKYTIVFTVLLPPCLHLPSCSKSPWADPSKMWRVFQLLQDQSSSNSFSLDQLILQGHPSSFLGCISLPHSEFLYINRTNSQKLIRLKTNISKNFL